MEFESSRYAFGVDLHLNRSFSRKVVAEHPLGSSVTARVDPEDPASAVLRVDGSARPRLVLVFLVPFHCLSGCSRASSSAVEGADSARSRPGS